MVVNTGSQNASLLGSPPIERPRYRNRILPTLQFNIDTIGMVQKLEKNSTVLEPVLTLAVQTIEPENDSPNNYDAPTVSAPLELVPKTQQKKGANLQIYPMLQQDLDLIRHVLVK